MAVGRDFDPPETIGINKLDWTGLDWMDHYTRSIRSFMRLFKNTGHCTLHPTADDLSLHIHSVYTVPYLFNCSSIQLRALHSLYTARDSYSPALLELICT